MTKKLRSLSTSDMQGEIVLLHHENASEKKMLGSNITAQLQQGSSEMHSEKLHNEKNLKVGKVKDILSKYEADTPVLQYQGRACQIFLNLES